MAGNSFGDIFRITTFGESHGAAIGVVIDGCPAGVTLSIEQIQYDLDRRRPGQSAIVTQRNEADTVQILSGLYEGKTLGSPIALLIQNQNQRQADYAEWQQIYRPSHADFTWQTKYQHRDHRGGGRASARETAARVAAGAVAKALLTQATNILVTAYVSQVGQITVPLPYHQLDLAQTETNLVRCPHLPTAAAMEALINQVCANGDTVGGCITGLITGCPVGLGEPVFDKLQAQLSAAMLSINAVKGFEYGSGFAGAAMLGSQHNDVFTTHPQTNQIVTLTNNSGGIQGGITNGMDIYFKVAFKPVATLMQTQNTVNQQGEAVKMQGKGRHDACVLPRAVPIVEAMAALVMADFWLKAKLSKI
ncbi:MAG: chorismate synthase [Sphingobacteriales bacterium]|jgi:chorismate synthase|nr:chorismate synthase [Sphingobacteriales bacterium]MBP9141713.1 chorismate synthase [Chitinophagales bacterium]MDA0198508.1 chorismate synthase [Bacteroidota bacterium]MBK7528883.1 chorismate synthase [Sphingobacteriales bacterium]MBK8679129.1 chorismate synthase [Sphingobacteriales bacterium]